MRRLTEHRFSDGRPSGELPTRHHLAGKPSNNRHTPVNFPMRFWRRVQRGAPDACWLWRGSKDRFGRGQVHLRWEGRSSVRRYAPVVAWELTHGPIAEGLRVCHRCDTPACCNPSHLFLGTQRANVLDCIRKGRRNAFGRQKLTESDVLTIRARAACGQSHASIARDFGLRRHSVTGIVNGHSWRHLLQIASDSQLVVR